jgi:hypothetical protein
MKAVQTLALLLTLTIGFIFAPEVQAQTAEASGLAVAEVYSTTLEVTHRSDLNFGAVVAGTNAQEVVKDPNQGGQDIASFRVTGESTASVLLTVTTDDLQDDQGNALPYTPEVTGYGFDNQTASQEISLTDQVDLNQAGEYYVWVGGSITVSADQAPGSYESTITVGAEYF